MRLKAAAVFQKGEKWVFLKYSVTLEIRWKKNTYLAITFFENVINIDKSIDVEGIRGVYFDMSLF